jgi:GGDEF domain-containing protein
MSDPQNTKAKRGYRYFIILDSWRVGRTFWVSDDAFSLGENCNSRIFVRMMYTYCMSQNTNDTLLVIAIVCFLVFWVWRLSTQVRQPKNKRASLPSNKLTPSEEQIKNANDAERAVNFFRIFTLRTNKVLIGVTGFALASLTFFFMPVSVLQWGLWLLVCGVILAGESIALHYLQKWINYRERFLLKQVYQIEEIILRKSGLSTTNAATGLYTREFAEHMLELYTSRLVGRVLPVTCLVIEIVGLETLKNQQGEDVASQVMPELAGVILKRVRISDIVYQPVWNRLGVVLLRYPAKADDVIEKHILIKCYEVLEKYNAAHHCDLQIHWSGAILPVHARTPSHMLHIGEASLEAIINVSKQTDARDKARRQQVVES